MTYLKPSEVENCQEVYVDIKGETDRQTERKTYSYPVHGEKMHWAGTEEN